MTREAGTGLVIVLALVSGFALLVRYPAIHDVTTTPSDPPRFRSDPPGDVDYPAGFAALQQKAYPDLAPLISRDSVDTAFLRAAAAAERMPSWSVVLRDDSLAVLQAVARTPLLGFADDVSIAVRPAEGGRGSAIHVRSRSRWGKGDFGTNARRIRAFVQELD
ncbi:MAG: DUF1499 domain-containing protein [Gemmatimonadetes bacterium]|nr:DUF1499 domain-containing protein [Gemmatimonadota bacterium]